MSVNIHYIWKRNLGLVNLHTFYYINLLITLPMIPLYSIFQQNVKNDRKRIWNMVFCKNLKMEKINFRKINLLSMYLSSLSALDLWKSLEVPKVFSVNIIFVSKAPNFLSKFSFPKIVFCKDFKVGSRYFRTTPFHFYGDVIHVIQVELLIIDKFFR